jgi:hypothetical membrane protein
MSQPNVKAARFLFIGLCLLSLGLAMVGIWYFGFAPYWFVPAAGFLNGVAIIALPFVAYRCIPSPDEEQPHE